ncbi:glycosyltransferase family 4 protein [Synechococcus sp. BSF8S]|nr:glycosyltransferase family 4 protein [Synechococcus sp. BSF8S]
MAKFWHQNGNRVHIGIRRWEPMPRPILDLEGLGIELKRYGVPAPAINRVASGLRRRLGVSSKSIHPLQAWLKRLQPDLLVFSSDCLGGLAGIQLAGLMKIPYAYIMQANSESWWPDDARRSAMNEAIDAADGVVFFVGERNRDLFEFQLGRRLPRSVICRNPHGANGLEPLPWPDPVGTAPSTLRLAFVGRLEPIAKGQDLLFQALAQPQWRDRSWHLSLFGSGHGEAGVKAMATLLGINDRLSFVPAYNSLKEVWSEHHALVLPSRYEGLPLSLVEAMTLGRPAVVTNVADSAVLLRDGLDGFVAEAPTVEHVSEALERLWQHQAQLAELGQSAAERVKAFLPANPIAKASEQILSLVGR